jgi:type IV pilus assembly protein PilX
MKPLSSISTSQRGMTLIIGLVMLLLLTIIGLAAIRGASLEERMAGNYRDRALAFQSAEAGLRAAETVLNAASPPTWNTTGYGAQVDQGGRVAYWESFNWNSQSILTNLGLDYVSSQPRYYVELIKSKFGLGDSGSGVDFESSLKVEQESMFRITAKATGGSNDTVVILQSTYKR